MAGSSGSSKSSSKLDTREEWRYHATYSGSPQGGILSPLLANVYLDKLDKFVETTLVPAYTRGERRKVNPPYGALQRRESEWRKMGEPEQAEALRRQKQLLPSLDPN